MTDPLSAATVSNVFLFDTWDPSRFTPPTPVIRTASVSITMESGPPPATPDDFVSFRDLPQDLGESG
jgi:hypothetical protein